LYIKKKKSVNLFEPDCAALHCSLPFGSLSLSLSLLIFSSRNRNQSVTNTHSLTYKYTVT
jgi:hypothetical protein